MGRAPQVGPRPENWIDVFLERRILTFSLFRQMAETEATFSGAVKAAQAAELSAPCYIILSGVAAGEGALITKLRGPEADNTYTLKENGWYLLETN